MMEKPKAQRMGKPYCHIQMLYLIQENGGAMKRRLLRETLAKEGYSKYCIYEAFRRNDLYKRIWFEGSGNSKSQIVHLTENYDHNLDKVLPDD